jgi:hypothetical protein
VEAYNHVCDWLNGKGWGLVHWEAMLEAESGIPGFAVDDAHLKPEHPGWNGGWVMVWAAALSPEALRLSLRRGRFYSTQGPLFHEIAFDGRELHCRTSEVQFARLVGPRSHGRRVGSFDGRMLREFSFPLEAVLRTEGFTHARIEVQDDRGRRAWTNTLFVAEGQAL